MERRINKLIATGPRFQEILAAWMLMVYMGNKRQKGKHFVAATTAAGSQVSDVYTPK